LKHPDQERRARAAVVSVLRYARAKQLREASIGDLREDLKTLRPSNGRKIPRHHAAMAYAEIPNFVRDLRTQQSDALSPAVIEFLLLTVGRASRGCRDAVV